RHLPGEGAWGCGSQVELCGLPLSRAGVPVLARAGHELLQYLFQPAARAHPTHLFAARQSCAVRRSGVDDHGGADLVHHLLPAGNSSLQVADAGHGQAPASHRRQIVSRRDAGEGVPSGKAPAPIWIALPNCTEPGQTTSILEPSTPPPSTSPFSTTFWSCHNAQLSAAKPAPQTANGTF